MNQITLQQLSRIFAENYMLYHVKNEKLFNIYAINRTGIIYLKGNGFKINITNIKSIGKTYLVIVRPLIDLTKDIKYKDKQLGAHLSLLRDYLPDYQERLIEYISKLEIELQSVYIQNWKEHLLFKYKFDRYGFIKNRLGIDINNPIIQQLINGNEYKLYIFHKG